MEKSGKKDSKGNRKMNGNSPIGPFKMFSKVVKKCISQKNMLQEHINDVQDQMNRLEIAVSQAEFVEEETIPSILKALTDLLICRDIECQNSLAPKAVSILYKIAKNQFLLKELVQTCKIHIPLCAYFNTIFPNEETISNVPVLELLFAVNRITEEPCTIKLAVLNLLTFLKKDTTARIVLGCLRNYFVYSNMDEILSVDLNLEQICYYMNRLTNLCSSDDQLISLYARTIIIAAITKHVSFRKFLPNDTKLFNDSLILIANTISTKDPEIKEASYFLCKYLVENVFPHISDRTFAMDTIIEEVAKLDEMDCNPIATCELIQVFLTHLRKTCLESFFNARHDSSSTNARKSNFAVLISWAERANKTFAIEGDLPLLALRLLSTIIKEYLVSNEVLDLLKKSKLPSVVTKILQKKTTPNNLIDAEVLNIQAACLNLVCLLYEHEEMLLFCKGLNHFILAVFQDNYALELAHNEKMRLTGLNIIIQTIFILNNTDDIVLSPEVISILSKLIIDWSIDTVALLTSGLSSGSPILRDICYKYISTARRWESPDAIDYLSLIKRVVEDKSIVSEDTTQISCISSTLSFSSISDLTTDNDDESARIERQLLDKDIEIKLLNKVISSMQMALNDTSCLVAKYSSQESHREDTQHLQNVKNKSQIVIKSLEEQLKVEQASIRDIRAERDKLVKNQTEFQKELNTKDAALDDLGRKMKTQEDELINFKHEVAKYQELLARKKDLIETHESRISELESINTTLQSEIEEKDVAIKDQCCQINVLEQDTKKNIEEITTLKKHLEESKQLHESIMKLMNSKRL